MLLAVEIFALVSADCRCISFSTHTRLALIGSLFFFFLLFFKLHLLLFRFFFKIALDGALESDVRNECCVGELQIGERTRFVLAKPFGDELALVAVSIGCHYRVDHDIQSDWTNELFRVLHDVSTNGNILPTLLARFVLTDYEVTVNINQVT